MKKLIPVMKVILKLRDAARRQTIRLNEKIFGKTEIAGNFLTEITNIFYSYRIQLKKLFPVILNSGNFYASIFKQDIKLYCIFQLPEKEFPGN